jgi:hypothetical protein
VGTFVHASTSARPATGDGVVGATPATAVVGRFADVSDDGRWVVYEGRPLGPDTRASTVFLRDRTVADPARAVTELTVPSPDLRSGESVRPVISGDGCVVVVVTQFAFDLFRDDDTGERWDVYRQVLPHCGGEPGDWELVSATGSPDGGLAAGDRTVPTERPAVSESGAVVAFTHRADGSKATLTQVSVVDLTVPLGDAGRSTPVPGTPLDQPATEFVHRGQFEPALSADGRTVAFTSDALADAAVPAWGSGPVPGGPASTQVYVWDRDAGPLAGVMLVSGRDGVAAATGADQPAVSGSGRFVAFRTAAPDLLDGVQLPDCTGGCPAQVVRHDLEDGSLVVVSAAAAAGADESAPRLAADGASGWPAITDDGSQVAFVPQSGRPAVGSRRRGRRWRCGGGRGRSGGAAARVGARRRRHPAACDQRPPGDVGQWAPRAVRFLGGCRARPGQRALRRCGIRRAPCRGARTSDLAVDVGARRRHGGGRPARPRVVRGRAQRRPVDVRACHRHLGRRAVRRHRRHLRPRPAGGPR